MKVSVSVDRYRCKGCGACVEEGPEVFLMDEDTEKAAASDEKIELTDDLERAVSICPTDCIEIDS